ncbi:hypothetical protein J2Z19_004647 [Ensifer adhaerens]|uniref:Uncharacterized protein n=1 Tax=Ensifer adhaerens TaxID=106592 RepID=A0ACC5T1R7_ENSAD|nr:hypothetical protein [Ensifer adhaerens]MBP1874914.1 hypothetical protein [Ensifer adhaerens]
MSKAFFIFAFATLTLPSASSAAQCPTAASAKNGFSLLQEEVQSEFRPYHGPIVKIVNRFGTSQPQTVFSYRGLIDLSLIDGDVQRANHPLSDLSGVFPLKKGSRHDLSFVSLNKDENAGTEYTYRLEVVGQETFELGDCKYKVLRVKQTTMRGAEKLDVWTALYSPDLAATVARIYDEGTAQEDTVAYERIRLLQR